MCMDRNRITQALITSADPDTEMLDDLIESKITEAVERVHMQAPYHLLENGHNLDADTADDEDDSNDTTLIWGDQCSGRLLLPDNFMRLVVFEMSDWERPVYTPITESNPQYKLQRSRVKAMRGNPQRPVCAIVQRPEGKTLEFYSCKSESATITQGVYLPYPEVDALGGIDISQRCYTAVLYTTAALAALAMGDADASAAMLEESNTYLTK